MQLLRRLLLGLAFAQGGILRLLQLVSRGLLGLVRYVLALCILYSPARRRLPPDLSRVIVKASGRRAALSEHALGGKVVVKPALLLSFVLGVKVGALGVQLAVSLQEEDTCPVPRSVQGLDGIRTGKSSPFRCFGKHVSSEDARSFAALGVRRLRACCGGGALWRATTSPRAVPWAATAPAAPGDGASPWRASPRRTSSWTPPRASTKAATTSASPGDTSRRSSSWRAPSSEWAAPPASAAAAPSRASPGRTSSGRSASPWASTATAPAAPGNGASPRRAPPCRASPGRAPSGWAAPPGTSPWAAAASAATPSRVGSARKTDHRSFE